MTHLLTTAFRRFRKNTLVSCLQVATLAIGIAAFFVIHLYVSFERSYDAFNTQSDHIYRVSLHDDRPSESAFNAAATPVGPLLRKDYPEVRAMARVSPAGTFMVEGRNFSPQDGVLWADSSLFSIFTFPLLEGDPRTALSRPFTAVLSKTAARKYFGTEDAVGKTLKLDGFKWGRENMTVMVTGVMEDIPENAHFRSDLLLSMTTQRNGDAGMDSAWQRPVVTYLLLAGDPEALRAKLPAFLSRYHQDDDGHLSLVLEPLRRIYLHSPYGSPISGNAYNVDIFDTIGFFILLLACFNFINLSTARAAEKAGEVCLRKILGATRYRLIGQLLGDALLQSVIAFLLASVLAALFLPILNQLSGKIVSPSIFGSLPVLFGIACSVGLAAGIYPAILLSSFSPTDLRQKLVQRGDVLRKGLVVFQFTVSVVLLIGTAVVFLQMSFLRSHNLGFKKDQMLVIPFQRDTVVQDHLAYIKTELLGIPHVHAAAASSGVPISEGFESADYSLLNAKGEMQQVRLPLYMVDDDYFATYRVKVLAGSTDLLSGVVLNQAAVKRLGYDNPRDAIGKTYWGEDHTGVITGVVADFNFKSLRDPAGPLMFERLHVTYRYLTLDMDASPATIRAVETRWNEMEPQSPFQYFFLDEAIDREYRSEMNLGRLSLWFGGTAIAICCLGLFGLALFATSRRTKEIGIRKVLGASVARITYLLSWDFLGLVVLASMIAAPLAWWVMHDWLGRFAYRIPFPWWIFPAAGVGAVVIALGTVSVHTVRAATANPVDSLRRE